MNRRKYAPKLPDQVVQAELHSAERTRWDESTIWQKRFWEHHIRDDADYRAHLRYCWVNPVKHGLVEHPRDWAFSSYHRDVKEADLIL